MKTSQSFGVHFTIRKGREKDGKTAVYASITINLSPLNASWKLIAGTKGMVVSK